MKKISNGLLINTTIMFIYIFILEMMVRIFLDAPLLDVSVIRIAISTFIVSFTISYIARILGRVLGKIFNIISGLAIGIYIFAEFGLYNFIGFFMGVGNTEQGTKVLGYVSDMIKCLEPKHWLFLVPIIIFLIYYIVFDKKLKYKLVKTRDVSIYGKVIFEVACLSLVVLFGLLYSILIKDERFQNELQAESNYSLWLYPENSNLAVNTYGVLVYGFCDIKSQILHIDQEKVTELLEIEEVEQTKNEVKPETNYTRHIDDTAWNKLIENTSNSTYKKLNNYFISRNITSKNDMTGIFKDKNLIIILMESTNELPIINPQDFPTFSKMYNEGISFRNNFTPKNNCSTGNNEFTVLSSLFTINNTCTANRYANNKYFEGAFNVFNRAGYHTTSYHDYTEKYYRRNKIHKGLGSSKYYGVTDLGMEYDSRYAEWPDDKIMFQSAKQYYMNEDKFMAYFATVSPHQTYNVPSEMGDRYKDEWKKKGYSTNLSRYLSKLQVLDEALEELLNELESTGKLDDTVIALFGDHYPYGLTDREINEYLKKNDAAYKVSRNSTVNRNVDRTPLIIYNHGTEAKQINKYTTIIDLLPTLLNMFDVEYDPRLYLGTDIFSDSHNSIAVFADGSWVSERGYYYAPSSKMNLKDGVEEYTREEMIAINKEIKKRQSMSASAIKSNYFKYLGEGLEKYKEIEITEPTTQVLNN